MIVLPSFTQFCYTQESSAVSHAGLVSLPRYQILQQEMSNKKIMRVSKCFPARNSKTVLFLSQTFPPSQGRMEKDELWALLSCQRCQPSPLNNLNWPQTSALTCRFPHSSPEHLVYKTFLHQCTTHGFAFSRLSEGHLLSQSPSPSHPVNNPHQTPAAEVYFIQKVGGYK